MEIKPILKQMIVDPDTILTVNSYGAQSTVEISRQSYFTLVRLSEFFDITFCSFRFSQRYDSFKKFFPSHVVPFEDYNGYYDIAVTSFPLEHTTFCEHLEDIESLLIMVSE